MKTFIAAIALCISGLAMARGHKHPSPPPPSPPPVVQSNPVTAPNTSANPSTPAFSNGTLAGSTNVSNVNVHTLLYAGNTTKVLVHWIPWFDGGNDSGINVQYSTSDPTYLTGFIADLQRRGVDGVMIDWMGQSDITNQGALALQPLTHGKIVFAIMLDAQLLGNTSGSTNQAKLINALNYLSAQYFSDPSYLTYGGKHVVGDFGLTASGGINWNTIHADFPNLQFVHLDNATSPDGFGIASSAGSFLWVNPTTSTNNNNLSSATNFYSRAITHPSQIAMGAAYKGFDSNPYAPWDGNEYVSQQCGATWLDLFGYINSVYSTSRQLPFLQLVTWDDYYEGTPLETGIDGCISLTASGGTGSISISLPTQTTVDHLELYEASGSSWNLVHTYATGTTSITGLATGTYIVKAVGKPFIANVTSGNVTVK